MGDPVPSNQLELLWAENKPDPFAEPWQNNWWKHYHVSFICQSKHWWIVSSRILTLIVSEDRIRWHHLVTDIFRSGYDKNLYFPLLNNDSTRSSQIQLANVYDLQGNNLLLDELVLMDRKYEFRKFSSSVHALIGEFCTLLYSV